MNDSEQVAIGATVESRDGVLGTVSEIERDPETNDLRYLVVSSPTAPQEVIVPALYIEAMYPQLVRLSVRSQSLEAEQSSTPPAPAVA